LPTIRTGEEINVSCNPENYARPMGLGKTLKVLMIDPAFHIHPPESV